MLLTERLPLPSREKSLDDDRWLGLRGGWSDLLKFVIGTLAFSIGISLFKQWVRIERQGE